VVLLLYQPEKLKPEAGAKAAGAGNANIGMTLVSTKNIAKMGSKVFAAPVRFSILIFLSYAIFYCCDVGSSVSVTAFNAL